MHTVGTKIVVFPTATGDTVLPHWPDYQLVQVRRESTTMNLGSVANKNKGKGEKGRQADETSGQRETEVQAGSPKWAPQAQDTVFAGVYCLLSV